MGRKLLGMLAFVAIGLFGVGCVEGATAPVAATPVPIPTSLPTAVAWPAAPDTAVPPVPAEALTPAPTRATTLALRHAPTSAPTSARTPAATLDPPQLRPLRVARTFKQLEFHGLTNLAQPAAGDDRLVCDGAVWPRACVLPTIRTPMKSRFSWTSEAGWTTQGRRRDCWGWPSTRISRKTAISTSITPLPGRGGRWFPGSG